MNGQVFSLFIYFTLETAVITLVASLHPLVPQ